MILNACFLVCYPKHQEVFFFFLIFNIVSDIIVLKTMIVYFGVLFLVFIGSYRKLVRFVSSTRLMSAVEKFRKFCGGGAGISDTTMWSLSASASLLALRWKSSVILHTLVNFNVFFTIFFVVCINKKM